MCDENKYHKIRSKLRPIITMDEFLNVICNTVTDIIGQAYPHNYFRELKMFNCLIRNLDIADRFLERPGYIHDFHLYFRLLIQRCYRMVGYQNNRIRVQNMWVSYFGHNHCDILIDIENILDIHDVCVSTKGVFNYEAISEYIFYDSDNEDSKKLINLDDWDDMVSKRVLIYLQKLDILACRNGSGLNYKRLLYLAIQTEYTDLCQWILNIMSQRNIIFDVSVIMLAYFKRVESYEKRINLNWFFELVEPFRHLMIFDNHYKIVRKYFENTLCVNMFDHYIWFKDTEIILPYLDWLKSCMMISGQKMNYVKMFENFQFDHDKSSIFADEFFAKRCLEVMIWLEQRILESGKIVPYKILTNPEFTGSLLMDWAKTKNI